MDAIFLIILELTAAICTALQSEDIKTYFPINYHLPYTFLRFAIPVFTGNNCRRLAHMLLSKVYSFARLIAPKSLYMTVIH